MYALYYIDRARINIMQLKALIKAFNSKKRNSCQSTNQVSESFAKFIGKPILIDSLLISNWFKALFSPI
jgi:hypothetical protein